MKIRAAIYNGNPVCNNQKQMHPHHQKPSQPSQPSHISDPRMYLKDWVLVRVVVFTLGGE
jgi:hypothetical protein